jgi:pimeloyl-[acyl-carrier protein] synthase
MTNRWVNSISRKWHSLFASKINIASKSLPAKRRRLLFVFQGRNGYRVGMGRELYQAEPVFRETVRRCSETVEERLGIKLVDAFENDAAAELIHQNEFHSILTHAVVHLSLSELWRSKGVYPDATIGLSLGEITSPYISNALTLEEVMSVARAAAQWDERLLARGKIIILNAGLEITKTLCRECPVSLELFAEYGFSTNEVFCAAEDVEKVTSFLHQRGIKHKVYGGDYAYHTMRFSTCKEIMSQDLSFLKPRPAQYKFYSSFSGGLNPSSTHFDAEYWYWMLAKPVLFNTALVAALQDGYDTILNIGPHPSLTPHLEEAVTALNKDVLILDSIRNDEPETDTINRTYETLKKIRFVKTIQLQTEKGTVFTHTLPEINTETLNLYSPEVLQNPYPFYEALREKGSVHFLEQHGYWLILGYDDVVSALKQPLIFSSKPAIGLDAVLLGAEPKDHTRARQVLSPFFSPQAMNKFSDYIQSSVNNLLNEASRKTEFDIVGDLAIPLTENVIAHLLGLSTEDIAALRERIGVNKYQLNYIPAIEEYFINYLEKIEKKPADNFCNRLLSSNSSDKLTKAEVASLMKLFWVAGTTTTSMLISTSTILLLQHPQVMFEIQNDLGLLPQFIEESLRLEAPEQTAWRTTTTEVEISGVQIPKDAEIRLCLAAANRDPKHYLSPESFILKRNPKDHLAFGDGHHFCIGAILAKLEARIALEVIFTRFPKLGLVQKLNEIRYTESSHFRALEKLIVGNNAG